MTGDPDWEQFLETEAGVRFVAIGEHRLRVVDTGAALTVIAGAGRLVHQARPEPFNEAVVRFLRSAS
jgi:pimeloyl-ACP methyl ester carboxylesterase